MFRASGSHLRVRGFLSVYLEGRDDEDLQDEDRQPLPALHDGDNLSMLRLLPEQHFTQPPPAYTEATLVKALEERGIGRPSTYAPVLSTVVDRGYVEKDGKRLRPTDLGMLVTDLLVKQFGDIVDLDFTATMEDKLDEIAQGMRPWVPVVRDFYLPLTEDLERAEVEVERLKPADEPTDEVCSEGHPMVIKAGRFGRFLACSNYPEHKESRPLPQELPPDAPEERCSHGLVMQFRTGRYGPYYASAHDCGETKPYLHRIGVQCPLDQGDIVEKRSKKGRTFYGCANWPACEWVSWNRPLPDPCPECGGIQVQVGRDGVRCLQHEGEPARFKSAPAKDGEKDGPPARRPAARKGRTTAKRSTARKPAVPRTRTPRVITAA
jgi:DNA topoisomerase-1